MEQVLLIQNEKDVIIESIDYKNELELQELIKEYPKLINLSSIFDTPLMIIGREFDRIDVMGLTANATPVIIECKRKENPDMRYLIAQVFEYASKLKNKNFKQMDELVSKYFASNKCKETDYKNKNLEEAFNLFLNKIKNQYETGSKFDFKEELNKQLFNGEFYLVIVVDKISDVAFNTIQFLNEKLDKLRIEIIEITKYSQAKIEIYVPNHINRSETKLNKPKPGLITYDEMLRNCSTNEEKIVKVFVESWLIDEDYSFEMGKKGFSARYKDKSIFWVFNDHLEIRQSFIKKNFPNLYDKIDKIKGKYFKKKVIKYSDNNYDIEKIKGFLSEVHSFIKNE